MIFGTDLAKDVGNALWRYLERKGLTMAIFKKVLCTNTKCNNWRAKLDIVAKDADGNVVRDINGKPVKIKKAPCSACGGDVKLAETYTVQWYENVAGNKKKRTVTTTTGDHETSKKILLKLMNGERTPPAAPAVYSVTSGPSADTPPPDSTAGTIPFNVLADRFHAKNTVKDKTRQEIALTHLKRYFGDKLINTFILEDLNNYEQHRMAQTVIEGKIEITKDGRPFKRKKPPRQVGASTVGRELSVLMAAFTYARNNKMLEYAKDTDNPFHSYELAPSTEIKTIWSMDDIEPFFKHLPDHFVPLFRFILELGCRISEATKLKWSHINYRDESVIFFGVKKRVKKPKNRVVPLSRRAQDILAEIPRTSEYVFTSIKTGTCWVNPRKAFLQAAKAGRFYRPDGGLMRPHDLRHVMLSAVANGGAGDKTVQTIAGHDDPRSTQRYIHTPLKVAREAMENARRA